MVLTEIEKGLLAPMVNMLLVNKILSFLVTSFPLTYGLQLDMCTDLVRHDIFRGDSIAERIIILVQDSN